MYYLKDILLNVFLAIAVDNLADAESLTAIEKEEDVEEGEENNEHNNEEIDQKNVTQAEETIDYKENDGQESSSRRSRGSRKSKRLSVRLGDENNDFDNNTENINDSVKMNHSIIRRLVSKSFIEIALHSF